MKIVLVSSVARRRFIFFFSSYSKCIDLLLTPRFQGSNIIELIYYHIFFLRERNQGERYTSCIDTDMQQLHL